MSIERKKREKFHSFRPVNEHAVSLKKQRDANALRSKAVEMIPFTTNNVWNRNHGNNLIAVFFPFLL